MGCELSHQIGLQLRQFLGQPSRNRLRSQLTRLPSLFQIAFEGGQRHAKQLHDLSSRAALVYRTHHSFPQIFRIRFHTSCSLSLLASRSFTYSITWLNSSASRCKNYPPNKRTDKTHSVFKRELLPLLPEFRQDRVYLVQNFILLFLFFCCGVEVFLQLCYFPLKSCAFVGKINLHLLGFGYVWVFQNTHTFLPFALGFSNLIFNESLPLLL